MTRSHLLIAASCLFCLGCAILAGCTASEDTSDEGLVPLKKSTTEVLRKELEYKDVATITGQVTYEGDLPTPALIGAIAGHADASICMRGGPPDTTDPTWRVDPASKGVANVVVYVQPPKDYYFKKPDDKLKTWEDAPIVDQPFCAFHPHVLVLYPQYYDGKQLAPTGQVLKVINSAEIGHNIKVAGSSDTNPSDGQTLSAKTGQYIFGRIRVDKRELTMNCDIHKWMTGYALTFDHPYATVTDPNGKFTIKNVPADVDIQFKGWHESLKRFDPNIPGGTTIKLKPGETRELKFTVTKK